MLQLSSNVKVKTYPHIYVCMCVCVYIYIYIYIYILDAARLEVDRVCRGDVVFVGEKVQALQREHTPVPGMCVYIYIYIHMMPRNIIYYIISYYVNTAATLTRL